MRTLLVLLLLGTAALCQSLAAQFSPNISPEDAIRIREFYRLAAQIQDRIWPDWDKVPSPLLLVTEDAEFLTHDPSPPKEFMKISEDVYARPRKFPVGFLATFPAFGPPSVIVVGQPKNTESKTSTPWLFAVMHEHFHQLQYSQPGYDKGVEGLGLSRGDSTGMWMLNYPFPYEKPEMVKSFGHLRNLLLAAVTEKDDRVFAELAGQYVVERKKFLAQLSPDDHKYFSFQLWQEGIARYTQIMSAEAAAAYRPTEEYTALLDYEPFAAYAARVRKETLDELQQADLEKWKRIVFYSFGATEGLLLDRLNPKWKNEYFQRMLSTDSYFEPAH
ncbi:MAG: hypothetical protein ABSA78_02225 [Candidatus Sulfotelmatobacter sp.]|jgi:hypothetical protein